jgi:hypothetical protein
MQGLSTEILEDGNIVPIWISLRQAVECIIYKNAPVLQSIYEQRQKRRLPKKHEQFSALIEAIHLGKVAAKGKLGLIQVVIIDSGEWLLPSKSRYSKLRLNPQFIIGRDSVVETEALNSSHFQEHGTIWEQDLAVQWDWKDYRDAKLLNLHPLSREEFHQGIDFHTQVVFCEIEILVEHVLNHVGGKYEAIAKSKDWGVGFAKLKLKTNNSGAKENPEFVWPEVIKYVRIKMEENKHWKNIKELHRDLVANVWKHNKNVPEMDTLGRKLAKSKMTINIWRHVSSLRRLKKL